MQPYFMKLVLKTVLIDFQDNAQPPLRWLLLLTLFPVVNVFSSLIFVCVNDVTLEYSPVASGAGGAFDSLPDIYSRLTFYEVPSFAMSFAMPNSLLNHTPAFAIPSVSLFHIRHPHHEDPSHILTWCLSRLRYPITKRLRSHIALDKFSDKVQ